MADTKEKEITLHNQGKRTYITKKGKLSPGASLTMSVSDAKGLLGQSGIVDAEKIVNSAPVQAENAAIRAEITELKGQIAAVNAEKDELKRAIAGLDGEGKDLEKQVKALRKSIESK